MYNASGSHVQFVPKCPLRDPMPDIRCKVTLNKLGRRAGAQRRCRWKPDVDKYASVTNDTGASIIGYWFSMPVRYILAGMLVGIYLYTITFQFVN